MPVSRSRLTTAVVAEKR